MELFALTSPQFSGGQIALTAFLAMIGFYLLLPRPRGRSVAGGLSALIAAVALFFGWIYTSFNQPMGEIVHSVLFWFFSLGALVFGTMLVVQRNPARGAIAFAFVVISTCGLFLLLAAPFLMAATIIIYAGAIIVTFLFVLMLSHVQAASNENDRSREPLLSALAAFAFVGLVLFSVYLTDAREFRPTTEALKVGDFPHEQRLPLRVVSAEEHAELTDVVARLDGADAELSGDLKPGSNAAKIEYFATIKSKLERVVGVSNEEPAASDYYDGTLPSRLEKTLGRSGEEGVLYRRDQQAKAVVDLTLGAHDLIGIRDLNYRAFRQVEDLLLENRGNVATVKETLHKLRAEVVLLNSATELPARNVENLGYLLYADYLLAIELAGTLLLVATIGAVAIANRKGVVA